MRSLLLIALATALVRIAEGGIAFMLGSDGALGRAFGVQLAAAPAASVLFAIPLLALLRCALGVKAPPRRQFPLPEPLPGGRMSQPPPDPGLPPRPHGRLQLRLGALGVAVVVLFMLLVLRLWALQVLNTRTFVAQAASEPREAGRRARAARRDPRRQGPRARAQPRGLRARPRPGRRARHARAATSCCCAWRKMLELEPRPLWERVDRQLRMDPVAPVTLATDIDVKLKWYLQENPQIFRGLSVAQVPLRFYPYRTLGAHIYGQLSEIGPKQLKDPRFHDYHRGDVIGQSGVERRYDAFLRGTDGIDAVTVDAFGQPTGAVRHVKAPVPGPQRAPHDRPRHAARGRAGARARACARAAAGGADAGAIVAHRPEDRRGPRAGLVSRRSTPTGSSRTASRSSSSSSRASRATAATPAHYPLLDRAIAGRYPAASTFKPFVAIAAVKERRVTPDELAALHAARLLLPQAVPRTGTRRSTAAST